MALDVKIFTSYFMPIFNISKRYVGSEEKMLLQMLIIIH